MFSTLYSTEFIKIIRAVGVGFIVMGAIGYIVKLVSVITIVSLPIILFLTPLQIHIPIRHLITV